MRPLSLSPAILALPTILATFMQQPCTYSVGIGSQGCTAPTASYQFAAPSQTYSAPYRPSVAVTSYAQSQPSQAVKPYAHGQQLLGTSSYAQNQPSIGVSPPVQVRPSLGVSPYVQRQSLLGVPSHAHSHPSLGMSSFGQQPRFINNRPVQQTPAMIAYIPSPSQYNIQPQQAYVGNPRGPTNAYTAPVQRYQEPQLPKYQRPPTYVKPQEAYIEPTTTPAPRCWRSAEGFPCCSKELDSFLVETFEDKSNLARWKGCNIQRAANDIQRMAQSRFNFSFETIVSQSDMAHKTRFIGDLMCKKRSKDGRITLLYATPVQYSLESTDYHPLTESEIKERQWSTRNMEVTSIDEI